MRQTSLQFQISTNKLWPGQKLRSKAEGETRWPRYTRAWRTETHTIETLAESVCDHGNAFCPVLKEAWRKASNFKSVQVVATDHDEASLEMLLADPFIRDHAAFIYATPSSTPEAPRSRAGFVLDQPIKDARLASLTYRR